MNKIISSLIILSLLFTGISSYFFNSDYFDKYVIKVNEELIYKDQFKKAVQREKYLLSKDMNQEFSWNKYDKDLEALIREQVLNKLIQEILLYQYSKKLGIKIGEDQIMEEILHFPIFQKNGIFDREKYKDFLSKNNILGKDFSKEIEKNLFIKKIIQAYLFDEFCLPSESFEYAKFLFQKRRIQILTLPILKYQKLQNVQEEEMKNYYRNHQEQFLFPKMAKVRYIKLDVNDRIDLDLKEEEIFDFYQNNREMFVLPERNYYSMIQTDSMKDAELILDKLNLGHSFQDLAKDFSTHVLSSKKDGSIGWIDKKSLSKTIIPANLIRVGQISKIIRFEEKYLIFRLDRSSEKYYKTFSESRSEIKDIISKDKSSKIFSEIKRSLLEVADKNDTTLLSNIQKKFHISAHQTDWFEFRSLPRQINFKKIEKFIFSNEIQPISVKNDRNKIGIVEIGKDILFLIQVVGYREESIKSFDLVKDEIHETISFRKAYEETEQDGKSIIDQLKSLKEVGEENFFNTWSVRFEDEKIISRSGIRNSSFLHNAFNMSISNKGNPSYCMIRDRNHDLIIIKLIGIIHVQPNDREIQLISSEILKNLNSIVMESLFSHLFSRAKIS